jgi:hypothetical protein
MGVLPYGTCSRVQVFAVDRTPSWDHASIVAATLEDGDIVSTELVASFNNTNIDELTKACIGLSKFGAPFIVDSYISSDLAQALTQRGIRVHKATQRFNQWVKQRLP